MKGRERRLSRSVNVVLLSVLLSRTVQASEEAREKAPEAGLPVAPRTAAEALDLWRRERLGAVARVARFLEGFDWARADIQQSFDLLRELAAQTPAGGAEARDLLPAFRGLLKLGESQRVTIPIEQYRASWQFILRMCLGLRPAAEVGPLLKATAREELDRAPPAAGGGAADGPAGSGWKVPDPLRNAIYAAGFLRYLPSSGEAQELAIRSRGNDRRLAFEILGRMGDPDAAPVLIEAMEESSDLYELGAAAMALEAVLGDAAEPHLLSMLEKRGPDLARAAIEPLFSICTESALRALLDLYQRSEDKRLKRQVDQKLVRFARALETPLDELRKLIQSDPGEASRKMVPLAHQEEDLTPGDRRLSREDLRSVLGQWEKKGSINVEEWSWVRDRHILDAAGAGDLPLLEAARASILKAYRPTMIDEADIVQRIYGAVQKSRKQGGTGK